MCYFNFTGCPTPLTHTRPPVRTEGVKDGGCEETGRLCDATSERKDEGENLTQVGESSVRIAGEGETFGRSVELATGEGVSQSETQRNRDVWQQIEALNTPCCVEFSCSVSCEPQEGEEEESVLSPTKRAKLSTCELQEGEEKESVLSPTSTKRAKLSTESGLTKGKEKDGGSVVIVFEWIRGDGRDLLHQIVQYLKNTAF